jgi:hypothetical protein
MSRRIDGRSLTNGPTENEHAHDPPRLCKPAHRIVRLSIITTRWPRTNIAVQRGAVGKKYRNQNRMKQIFFAACFGLAESRKRTLLSRNGCATILRLTHLTNPSSPLKRSK